VNDFFAVFVCRDDLVKGDIAIDAALMSEFIAPYNYVGIGILNVTAILSQQFRGSGAQIVFESEDIFGTEAWQILVRYQSDSYPTVQSVVVRLGEHFQDLVFPARKLVKSLFDRQLVDRYRGDRGEPYILWFKQRISQLRHQRREVSNDVICMLKLTATVIRAGDTFGRA
jgi:hypothetical protein